MQTNAYSLEDLDLLPLSVEESLDHFEKDESLRDRFDPEFTKAYVALKRHEIEKARAACPNYGTDEWHENVTDWERISSSSLPDAKGRMTANR